MPKRTIGLDADGLSVRERAFVRAYGGNATSAAAAAGYGSPAKVGGRVLRRPHVARAIERRQARAEARAIVTREELERFLADTMRGDSDNPREKIYRTTRLKAAEQLAKLNAYDKAPSSIVVPVIGIKIET
jgi:phage terminase small subunit